MKKRWENQNLCGIGRREARTSFYSGNDQFEWRVEIPVSGSSGTFPARV